LHPRYLEEQRGARCDTSSVAAFPEPGALRAGDRLDRYELLCPLAYGGMAAVWLARNRGHRLMERLVVVKTILPQFASQEHFQTMFLDEARVAAAIDHPNVARTLDVGEKDDLLYLVMEWIDGESLSRLHRAVEKNGAKLPAGVILRIVADACAGLHAAHELRDASGALLNVVHRDVSPQNVLVSTTGVAKLIDFGVAKARDRASEGTTAGELKGKIRYMSPEQALGRDVDRRADIWSLGAMLYEMFARVAPYDGPNEVATLHLLTSGEPPPPLPPHVPREVAAVVERSLAHDRDRRFSTAAEMQRALEGAMLDIGAATTPAQVASLLEGHLKERAIARRRSVEAALAAAARRDRASGSGPVERPSRPASVLDTGSSLAIDTPSHTSTATLGSAAVEWPPATLAPEPRRRRGIAVAMGMGAVVALIGVGAVAARLSSNRKTAAAQPPLAPITMTSSAELPAAVPAAWPSTSATAPAATAPVATASAAPTDTTMTITTLPTAAPVPRPRPAVRTAPPPKPAPSAAPPKKRDYGF
jgi:eukaryotic-like serine/threonine-protein kinase